MSSNLYIGVFDKYEKNNEIIKYLIDNIYKSDNIRDN